MDLGGFGLNGREGGYGPGFGLAHSGFLTGFGFS